MLNHYIPIYKLVSDHTDVLFMFFTYFLGFLVAKCNSALPNSVIQPGYCPTVWASGLGNPRSLEIASNGDILTVESSNMQVTVLWDDNNNGYVFYLF